jgi:hypothetical protein
MPPSACSACLQELTPRSSSRRWEPPPLTRSLTQDQRHPSHMSSLWLPCDLDPSSCPPPLHCAHFRSLASQEQQQQQPEAPLPASGPAPECPLGPDLACPAEVLEMLLAQLSPAEVQHLRQLQAMAAQAFREAEAAAAETTALAQVGEQGQERSQQRCSLLLPSSDLLVRSSALLVPSPFCPSPCALPCPLLSPCWPALIPPPPPSLPAPFQALEERQQDASSAQARVKLVELLLVQEAVTQMMGAAGPQQEEGQGPMEAAESVAPPSSATVLPPMLLTC